MSMVAQAAKEAVVPEAIWIAKALKWFMVATAAMVLMAPIEGHLYPVFTDYRLKKVDVVPMDGNRGEQLCFDYSIRKARWARGTLWMAEVYHDDFPHPVFRGLTHRDGTPYGGGFQNTPPGRYEADGCVAISDLHGSYSRIGIRLQMEFKVPWRLWKVQQPEIWIDYYRDRPATK